MTDHDAGYVQALMDMQVAIRTMIKDLSPSPEGKIELLGIVSFLDILIKTKRSTTRPTRSAAEWRHDRQSRDQRWIEA